MPDHLGYRKKLGTLGPSTNTIVQPDFDDLRPAGVTNHYMRIPIPNDPVTDNESFLQLVENINQASRRSACRCDHLRKSSASSSCAALRNG